LINAIVDLTVVKKKGAQMTTETLEELRQRLLRQHNVQQMIQARAYEIYLMRGGQPGGEAQDWFHAESEVLAFLLARESAREDEQAKGETAGAAASETLAEAPATKKPRTRAATKSSKAKQPKKTATKIATPRKRAGSKSKSQLTSKTGEGEQ